MNKITIIGIGDDGIEGLTHQAREALQSARRVLGPSGLMEKVAPIFGDPPPDQQILSADLEAMPATIEAAISDSADEAPIMLASGDPLFYGTTRFLFDRLGKDRFEVFPHVSSMQLAFARVKESWDEAYLTNLATQSLPKVVDRIRVAEKVGVFTSIELTPRDLAQALLEQGVDYFTVYVCENLGSKDECVTRGSLAQIANQDFANLNVMILVRMPDVPDRPASMQGRKVFGNPDDCFLQSQPKRGLLTQCEVRVLALSEMDLGPGSTAWDVGAGSGSVAIEAAQLAPGGQVFGIEMDVEDYNLLIENSRTFGVNNLTPVLGEAPAAWKDLPAPDAIFIGGTGRGVLQIIDSAWPRLKAGGRLVVQMASLDTVTALVDSLKKLGVDPQVLMINLARSREQLDALRLEAANPAFLVSVKKEPA
ncbi:MAG: precorrin-6y C5,15-methyltransferase (decarboxylating) subunit CbiE [Planctomycetota bacterium]|nr:precorrin-6y C5,15-methyltransferase (decarboxylating) subunit CbiE [Planctomycetota bacterium]